jgi:hypothetical protein
VGGLDLEEQMKKLMKKINITGMQIMSLQTQELMDLISKGETLKVEFKSDLKPLSDRELVATVMNLSNSECGEVHSIRYNPAALSMMLRLLKLKCYWILLIF